MPGCFPDQFFFYIGIVVKHGSPEIYHYSKNSTDPIQERETGALDEGNHIRTDLYLRVDSEKKTEFSKAYIWQTC
jgi:hypothetical protein